MSEHLPYEQQLQQQWNNIPLPDEDAAWEDMIRRLEEDNDDRGIIFWWRPGCAWALLLLILGLAWWIIRPEKWLSNHQRDGDKHTTVSIEQNGADKKSNNPTSNNPDNNNGSVAGKTEQRLLNGSTQKRVEGSGEKKSIRQNGRDIPSVVHIKESGSREISAKPVTDRERRKQAPVRSGISLVYNGSVNNSSTTPTKNIPSIPSTVPAFDTVIIIDNIKPAPDLSMVHQPAAARDSSVNNRLFLSTGIALQQQLPVAGQKATPYNSQGRKGSLSDYIPSVYVRLNKKNKWFLQAEFRYGAPQYTKELLYEQESIADSGMSRFVTNSAARLKKTFYHQLPLTFNYYALPGWSVGGGVVWNKFYAAISDRETIYHDNLTQTDSVLFKGIVSIKDDTSGAFAKSYMQVVIETQYRWKRFSVGARYTFGLQPYIRFTLPGAGAREEKNSSIQAFLRFELWRPKSR